MFARRPWLRFPLMENRRRLRHQWCDERQTWRIEWNDIGLTDKSNFCLQHHDGGIRVWKYSDETTELLRYASPHWSCTRYHDLSPIEKVWSMLAQRLALDTPPTSTPDQLCQ
ncbi:transposable element Tcb1 transposase [Trichonephila clavipes]|nr:transposable element Tcb1 transposase [Trichonephila clavipes]